MEFILKEELLYFSGINMMIRPIDKTENSNLIICEDIKTRTKYYLKVLLSQNNNSFRLHTISPEISLLNKMKNQKGIAELLDSISIEHNNLKYYLLLFKYYIIKSLNYIIIIKEYIKY